MEVDLPALDFQDSDFTGKSSALSHLTCVTKGGLFSEGILIFFPLPTKGAKLLHCLSRIFEFPANKRKTNVLLRGVIWHLLLAMGPKFKYLQRLSHLYFFL
jgi:hypothetical protein